MVTIPSLHVFSNALVSGLLLGGLFAVTALGLSLVFGVTRLINLAHGEVLVLGAYVSLALVRALGLDPLLSILVVAPVVFAAAVPIFWLLLAPVMGRGPEPAMLTTFGISVIAQSLFIMIFSGDSQTLAASYAARSVRVAGLHLPIMYLVSFGFGVGLCLLLDQAIRRTNFGREVRASSEDGEAAAALGVNVRRVHLLVFGIAAACTAIGGVLVGITFAFTPTSGLTYLLSGFAVVVLGGLGSVRGTFLGALGLGLVESVGGSVFGDGYRDLVGFIVFLIVLSIRPQGLFGRRLA
jgi:branched-chain amino acid transport system permease protein